MFVYLLNHSKLLYIKYTCGAALCMCSMLRDLQKAASSVLFLVAMPFAPSSFLLLVVRHLLLEAMHLFLVASCY